MVVDDEDDSFYSGGRRFFDCELDERLSANREHLLGNGFGGWHHTRAEACRRDHRLADFCARRHGKTVQRFTKEQGLSGSELQQIMTRRFVIPSQ